MRLTFEALRDLAVDPREPGAYAGSIFGEGNLGVHTHDGGVTLHVWVAGLNRVAVVMQHGTCREYHGQLPENVRHLFDLLPEEL